MSTTSLRVTVVQDAPEPRNLDENIARVLRGVASSDADLIVFPELFLSGYQTQELGGVALTVDDDRLTPLAAACRSSSTALLVGFVEAAPEGFFDAYLAIDRTGAILPAVRKTHLFGGERDVFRRGDTITPISLCGVPIGVINCFEIEFPEVARTLALRGAKILIAGSANMHPYAEDHRIAAVARVFENRIPLAYSNRVGTESGHDFCGSSRVINESGVVLGELGSIESGELTAELSLLGENLPDTDMLSQRLPALYER